LVSRIRPFLFRLAVAAGAAGCIAMAALARQAAPERQAPWALSWGRTYTHWLYHGEADRLWAHFGPDLRQRFGDAAHLRAFADETARRVGVEQAVLGESFDPGPGYATYKRRARFSLSSTPILVEWSFGEFGTIGSFVLRPEPPPPPSTPSAHPSPPPSPPRRSNPSPP
jgi:hypothetical protein